LVTRQTTSQEELLLVSRDFSRIQVKTTSTTQELVDKILCKHRIHTLDKLASNNNTRMINYYQIRPMMTISGTNLQVREVIQINSNMGIGLIEDGLIIKNDEK